MHKLKQRLEPIRLTTAQKQKMIANAKRPPKKQRSYILIILPAFLILSAFFVSISLAPNSWTLQPTSASTSNESLFDNISLAMLVWGGVSSIELIAIYYVAKVCIANTTRWQTNEKAQEWHAFLSKPIQPKIAMFLTLILIWSGTIYFKSLWYSQLIFVLLSVVLVTLWLLYNARGLKQSHCPHCEAPFTRKQIFRKTHMAYREKCDSCQKLIYLERNAVPNTLMYVLITLAPIWLQNLFSLYFSYVLLFSLLLSISLTYFYMPIMVQFTDRDTTMDDFKK